MTKKTAVDRLMECFNAEPKWREFFEKIVDDMNGEENILSEDVFSQILKRLNNFT